MGTLFAGAKAQVQEIGQASQLKNALLTGWTHFSGVVGHGIDSANP
jgi:hypothetical protein